MCPPVASLCVLWCVSVVCAHPKTASKSRGLCVPSINVLPLSTQHCLSMFCFVRVCVCACVCQTAMVSLLQCDNTLFYLRVYRCFGTSVSILVLCVGVVLLLCFHTAPHHVFKRAACRVGVRGHPTLAFLRACTIDDRLFTCCCFCVWICTVADALLHPSTLKHRCCVCMCVFVHCLPIDCVCVCVWVPVSCTSCCGGRCQ